MRLYIVAAPLLPLAAISPGVSDAPTVDVCFDAAPPPLHEILGYGRLHENSARRPSHHGANAGPGRRVWPHACTPAVLARQPAAWSPLLSSACLQVNSTAPSLLAIAAECKSGRYRFSALLGSPPLSSLVNCSNEYIESVRCQEFLLDPIQPCQVTPS